MIRWSQRSIWSPLAGGRSSAGRRARRPATIAIEKAAARRPKPSSRRRSERPSSRWADEREDAARAGAATTPPRRGAAVGRGRRGRGGGGGAVAVGVAGPARGREVGVAEVGGVGVVGGVTGRLEARLPLETVRPIFDPAGLRPLAAPLMTLPLGTLAEVSVRDLAGLEAALLQRLLGRCERQLGELRARS